jgi:DNA-binding NarL/FixJ family response regulator
VTAEPAVFERLRTVLVCDDRRELREAIAKVLSDVPRFVVVGEATDDVTCLQRVLELRPDVLILDVSMPGGGPAVAKAAKEMHPTMHILVFSGRQDARVQREMLSAGADQYVVKTGRLRPLLAALDRAVVNRRHLENIGSPAAASAVAIEHIDRVGICQTRCGRRE